MMACPMQANLGNVQTVLRESAAVRLLKRGCALQANVVIGVVPEPVSQDGENLGIIGTGGLFRPESIEQEIDGLDAHPGVFVIAQRPDECLPDRGILFVTLQRFKSLDAYSGIAVR